MGARAARLRALDEWREPVHFLGFVTIGAGTARTLKYSILQQALLWLPIAILQDELLGLTAVPAEVNDMRLMVEQQFL